MAEQTTVVRWQPAVRGILLLIALCLFLLTAFGVQFGPAHLGWLGMTFLAASFFLP